MNDGDCKANWRLSPQTLAAQALGHVEPTTRALVPPVHMSTTYERDADGGYSSGRAYSRPHNPSYDEPEELLARLEGGHEALLLSSGMAAATTVFQALLPGDHVVAPRIMYWALRKWLTDFAMPWGLDVEFVDTTDPEVMAAAMRPGQTRLVWIETPANPTWEVTDIRRAAEIAHSVRARLAVDATVATPVLTRPIELGADIVVHSATKYLDGQGRCMGGAVLGSEEHMTEVQTFLRTCGPTLSPFNAWVFLKGLETLRLRMDAHSRTALELAQWLRQQPAVERVYYAGLEDHPGHDLACRQQRAFGGVLSFEVRGGRQQAWQCIDATRIMSLTANLGDAKTTIVHPATTTHGRLTDAERAQAGIADNLIRVAAGLEDPEDLKADLQRGLAGLD